MPQEYFLPVTFGLASLFYLFELVWLWMAAAQVPISEERDYSTPITLLIAARDEQKNLKKNLTAWLSQKHNGYEVLIVNDCSIDDSEYILAEYQRKFPHLEVMNLKESAVFKGGKKVAMTLGIKGAQFDRILFTDADCMPSSDQWLATMNASFNEGPSIVLGVGLYAKFKGLLNYLIRMDALQIAFQYVAACRRGIPYMGVGRNLAYTQSIFFENDGFKSHQAILSGDDDLFVNEVATKSNTRVCVNPKAQTISEPRMSFSSWFQQKRRHMSTASNYSFKTKWLLMIKPFRIVFFYSSMVFLLLKGGYELSVVGSFALLYIGHSLIFLLLNKKYGKVDFYFFYPITEILLFVISIFIYLSTWLSKPTKWT